MNYIVNTVSNHIVSSALSTSAESLFAINGFDDPVIYARIGQLIIKKLKEKGDTKTVTIKLAGNKWNYFNQKYKGTPELHTLEQNGWIADKESTTYYRNLHNTDILVLMGAEDEDDSIGSLKDITTITPESFIDYIPKKAGKPDYSDIFSFSSNWNDEERKTVNNLYYQLFEFVTPNIVKLSGFADKWNSSIDSIDEFRQCFFSNLPEWGLPKKVDSLPSISEINGRSNVLRQEFNFITGTLFSQFSARKYKVYETKLREYEEKEKRYSSKWDDWISQEIKSYDQFSDILLRYISGDRSYNTKEKLIKTDFSITEDILGLKLEKGEAKIVGAKVYGDPLSAFSRAIMDIMTEFKEKSSSLNEEDSHLSRIVFDFHEASIIAESDNKSDLLEQWVNICTHTNGVFEYINNNAMFTYEGDHVEICCEPADYFDITLKERSYVSRSRGNKVTNKIEFKVSCYSSSGQKVYGSPDKDCEWLFKYNEDWLISFTDLCKQDFVKTKNNPIIPISSNRKLRSLISSKSRDDFYQILKEESDTVFSCNLLETSASNYNDFSKNSLYSDFLTLGLAFSSFANELASNGLYNVLRNSTGNDTIKNLISSYEQLGSKILASHINENELYIMDYFIHAFNILEKDSALLYGEAIDCCIVPPWHPASLEKILHMDRFFMDGCHEYWSDIDSLQKTPSKKINGEKVDELIELSLFQNSVDLFLNKDNYYGVVKTYGFYSLYSEKTVKSDNTFRDLIDKDAVFDDDFKAKSYSIMNDDAVMIYQVIENYIKSFPDAANMLSLVFINPSDLQPAIAAINKYINEYHSTYGSENNLYINLRFLVKPENMGGKNYLTYWMNETFDLDSNVKIKTYLNVWKNEQELEQSLNANNDIAFVMDLLKTGSYSFKNVSSYKPAMNECYFPIVYRPALVSHTSVNRAVEITQPQFIAENTHAQVVHYRKGFEDPLFDKTYCAVKNVGIDSEQRRIVNGLHKKAYWVVCIDSGLDGSLIKSPTAEEQYSVIGFSTGKGKFGQYNITITARSAIVNSIESKFSQRLRKTFAWDNDTVDKATRICMREASYLDGISVLRASNKNDYSINEFMAYVLTALREKSLASNSPLKTIIHLDSYKHWFSKNDSKSLFDTSDKNYRPDFLVLEVIDDQTDKVHIRAKIVECKISKIENKYTRLNKAAEQIKIGENRLREIFDPSSNSIKRRYWYAQLYRALAFAQITFEDKSKNFSAISEKLRKVLDGEFEIEWKNEILGFWLDVGGSNETTEVHNGANVVNIPQLRVQALLLDSSTEELTFHKDIDFIDVSEESHEDSESVIDEIYSEEPTEEVGKTDQGDQTDGHTEEAKNKELYGSHVPFSMDEALLLLSVLIQGKAQNASLRDIASTASTKLRALALSSGAEITESFRTTEGLIGRLKSLLTVLDGDSYASISGTKVFEDAVKLFKTNANDFNSRVSAIISRLSSNESGENDNKGSVIENEKPVSKETESNSNGVSSAADQESIRVLIGKDKNTDVFWEFGNKNLANRHLLITGTSGQGKTYCIQTLLYELSKTNVSSVIFDYTEGFRQDQLETKFLDRMKNKIQEEIVYSSGVPINPFKRHEITVSGIQMLEKPADVANRIANILTHVYGFGEQQYSAVFTAALNGLKKYKEDMNMDYFRSELEAVQSTNSAAKTVISKMNPFFHTVEFTDDNEFDWGTVLYGKESSLTIFQLTQIDRTTQVIITELMLWDAWYYAQKVGNKDKPFVVVLDEAQNLSHKENSPSAKILTEGRKFGWSAWFATQSLKVLSDEEVVRLMQASMKLYFKPTDEEITKTSKLIDATDSNKWVEHVKNLTKGRCIVVGDRIRQDGSFGSTKPTVTSVVSFEGRD